MFVAMGRLLELEMNKPLPFLISIPHGGTEMPPELEGRVVISPHDLFDDSDSFTREIYDVGDRVVHVIIADIARAFVDVSRAPHQMPPDCPDGLIKSSTCLLKPIYAPDKHPDADLRQQLFEKYYQPYHRQLEKWSHSPAVKLGLDCHSMLPVAPDIAPDTGSERPLINLGNRDGAACPMAMVESLADSFCAVFDLSPSEVTINEPFKGGFITQKFANTPIPWIQIEMNRTLYLHENYFERSALKIQKNRLAQLNTRFRHVLEDFSTILDSN